MMTEIALLWKQSEHSVQPPWLMACGSLLLTAPVSFSTLRNAFPVQEALLCLCPTAIKVVLHLELGWNSFSLFFSLSHSLCMSLSNLLSLLVGCLLGVVVNSWNKSSPACWQPLVALGVVSCWKISSFAIQSSLFWNSPGLGKDPPGLRSPSSSFWKNDYGGAFGNHATHDFSESRCLKVPQCWLLLLWWILRTLFSLSLSLSYSPCATSLWWNVN